MPASYLDLAPEEWEEKLDRLHAKLRPCTGCPRECKVERAEKRGLCRAPENLVVSSINKHYGEEPPISGHRGSGTIFLTHCNLYCVFCQNYPISQYGNGSDTTLDDFAAAMLRLQDQGAHNINFVSPTHYTSQIVEAIHKAVELGLKIPIVWNSNAYESVETLEMLDGIVDIYMPDLKYSVNENAERFSRAPGYWETATAAIREMHRQVGELQVNDMGVAERGLLIRHLVLPNDFSGTPEVLRFIAEEISADTSISLMAQYFPAHRAASFEDMDRTITFEEYQRALGWLNEFGLTNGYTQESSIRFC